MTVTGTLVRLRHRRFNYLTIFALTLDCLLVRYSKNCPYNSQIRSRFCNSVIRSELNNTRLVVHHEFSQFLLSLVDLKV